MKKWCRHMKYHSHGFYFCISQGIVNGVEVHFKFCPFCGAPKPKESKRGKKK